MQHYLKALPCSELLHIYSLTCDHRCERRVATTVEQEGAQASSASAHLPPRHNSPELCTLKQVCAFQTRAALLDILHTLISPRCDEQRLQSMPHTGRTAMSAHTLTLPARDMSPSRDRWCGRVDWQPWRRKYKHCRHAQTLSEAMAHAAPMQLNAPAPHLKRSHGPPASRIHTISQFWNNCLRAKGVSCKAACSPQRKPTSHATPQQAPLPHSSGAGPAQPGLN